jgi:hypothetical protein
MIHASVDFRSVDLIIGVVGVLVGAVLLGAYCRVAAARRRVARYAARYAYQPFPRPGRPRTGLLEQELWGYSGAATQPFSAYDVMDLEHPPGSPYELRPPGRADDT